MPVGDRPFVPVTDEMLRKPDPADWLMWRRTLDSWGYSPLEQINRSNVAQLTHGLDARHGARQCRRRTPLVYNGVMYLPESERLHPGARRGDRRPALGVPAEAARRISASTAGLAINRNLAIYGDTIIDTSADDFVFALDAQTGELAWETQILDYQKGAQQTSGPIIANGKIISGRGCEPEGGPDACVITAHDARTGKELWRTRTIPKPGEPGDETWGDVPDREALARRHVDGAELRPGAEPDLHRHVGHVAGAEVHARRQRQASTSTTTPRWR